MANFCPYKCISHYFLVILLFSISSASVVKFPDKFLFGASSSAYQIEGGWNEDGKSKSIWDELYHSSNNGTNQNYFAIPFNKYAFSFIKNHKYKFIGIQKDNLFFQNLSPEPITRFHSPLEDDNVLLNGDVACDSYHKYEEDIKLLKELGVKVYRFSLSWPRILPKGQDHTINQDGVDYYHKVIDLLLANNIEPLVTIYHWDLPQSLQVLGGWANENIIRYYVNYANFVFKTYGNKVKYWTTINEPRMISEGYGGKYPHAPQLGEAYSGIGDYMVIHNMLIAHARVYRLYEKYFKTKQKGEICICLDTLWGFPNNENSEEDKKSAQLLLDAYVGLFVEPLVTGEIPKTYLESIKDTNKKKGINVWRIIQYTEEEKNILIGSYDFISVNYYHSLNVTAMTEADIFDPNNDLKTIDQRAITPSWDEKEELEDTVLGFRNVMQYLNDTFGKISDIREPKFFISENGLADDSENNKNKIEYHQAILTETKNLIDDGVNIIGYSVWSLMDSFEWVSPSSSKFGIYKVDFRDADRPRTKKPCVEYFQYVFQNKTLPDISTILK
ncbi:myrosinase 1-like isoform X2 [Daktulosphaira vitifoliae]|uniref:myrosinase 1-like isoform X2 n=1 Tax=Daktulosphaira vitifoliae TaxID=58002 RepID=UPI0021AA0D09|nr:myrosinase 1-like isoform X2 [Daktulosphaira vitifoliae]